MKNRDKMNFDGNAPQNRESELSECQGESLGSRFAKRKVIDLKDSGIPWIGEIPKDWEIRSLKRQFKIISGATPKTDKKEYWDGEIIWITPADYKNEDHFIGQGKRNISIKGLEACGTELVPIGSLIFSKRAPIGTVSLSKVKLCTNQGCLSCVPFPYSDSNFFYYVILSASKEFELLGTGTTFMEISSKNFSNFQIGVPSLQEQKTIAEFLDRKCGEIDELVALQNKMIEELKAYKQSIITETVTKGLNPNVPLKDSGIEWIGEIPQHWKVVRLGAIGSTINGISKDASSFGEGFPFVSYKDVYNHYNLPNTVNGLVKSNENEQKVFSVNYGDIFFTRTSETIEEIGFSSVCLNSIPNAVFAGFLIRFRPIPNIIEPKFSKFFFRAICHRNYFVKEMNLVTRASLSQNLLKSMPVLLPPLSEQQEIADFLDKKCSEIDSLIELKQQKIEELKDYKKSIIYEYVTGKKSVGT